MRALCCKWLKKKTLWKLSNRHFYLFWGDFVWGFYRSMEGFWLENANLWSVIRDSGRLLGPPLQLSQFPQTTDHWLCAYWIAVQCEAWQRPALLKWPSWCLLCAEVAKRDASPLTVRDNLFRLCPNLGQHPPPFSRRWEHFSKIGLRGTNSIAIPLSTPVEILNQIGSWR